MPKPTKPKKSSAYVTGALMPTKPTKTKAPKKLTINVTEEDIKKGVPGDPCRCPISRALKRQGATNTEVDCNDISWIDKGGNFWTPSPPIVEAFIKLFDETEGRFGARALLRPFSFTVKPVRDDQDEQETT